MTIDPQVTFWIFIQINATVPWITETTSMQRNAQNSRNSCNKETNEETNKLTMQNSAKETPDIRHFSIGLRLQSDEKRED